MTDRESVLGDFRVHLLDAASHRIQRLYPDFWAIHQQALTPPEIQQLVIAGPPAGSEAAFAEYRKLLTTTLDLDVSIRFVRASLRMLGSRPNSAFLVSFGMNEGEWSYYQFQMWVHALAGLFERAKKLIALAVRSLRRPYDPSEWKATEARLVSPVEKLRELTKPIRDPFAHGGALEPVAQTGLWEGMSAARIWPDLSRLLEPMALSREGRYEVAKKASQQALALIIRTVRRLDAAIDWTRVKEASA